MIPVMFITMATNRATAPNIVSAMCHACRRGNVQTARDNISVNSSCKPELDGWYYIACSYMCTPNDFLLSASPFHRSVYFTTTLASCLWGGLQCIASHYGLDHSYLIGSLTSSWHSLLVSVRVALVVIFTAIILLKKYRRHLNTQLYLTASSREFC